MKADARPVGAAAPDAKDREDERLAVAIRRALTDWQPPLRDRQFWAVQGLVMLLAIGHAFVEESRLLGEHSSLALLPPALYFVPVVYSAVHFGLRGSLPTAIWACILVVPNVALYHAGLDALGEVVQMVWIVLVAVFVGVGVDRERSARDEAEGRERAWRLSEARYRSIFEAAAEPIVVLDHALRVEDANAAAGRLFGWNLSDMRGRELPESLGQEVTASMRTRQTPDDVARGAPIRVVPDTAGAMVVASWIQPVVMSFTGPDGMDRTQVMLLDVTASHEREQGLQEITRQTLRAREEEGQRIARELHDGPVQTLVALWRTLDDLEDRLPPPEAAQVREARVIAEDVAGDLRRVSRDLRPSVLDDLGIAAAIKAEAGAAAARSGIDVRVDLSGEVRRIDSDAEVSLLRIGQEALRNIEQHASASHAAIELGFLADEVSLVVEDDGRGLDPIPGAATLLSSDHFGLIGMRERARLVGGEMTLGRSALGGLRVTVRVPTGEP